MGFDDILGKVDDIVDKNAEKISEGIDRAGDFIDEKTGGKFSEHIDKVQEKVGDQVDKMANDDK
jgi:hypothetical protein